MSNQVIKKFSKPLQVSVVIPCYNYGRFLKQAIDSALEQTYPYVEVIVIDDGSTDNTPEVAASYGSRIRYIRQTNRGQASARNNGISQSSGDLIALLDADDRWLPEKLAVQVPFFSDSTVGLVHSGYRVFDTKDERTTSTVTAKKFLDVHNLLARCEVQCLTTIFPKKVWEDVAGFDTKLHGTEDWDLWIRIAAQYTIRGCPEQLAEYRVHGANVSSKHDRQFQNCMKLLYKHRHLHLDCVLCDMALKDGEAMVREDYEEKLSCLSRIAWNKGQKGKACI